MISTTQAAREAIAGNARRFRARIVMNGTAVAGYIRSADVYKGSCGNERFMVGCAFAGYTELVIDRCLAEIAGREFGLEIGVVVNGLPDYVRVGTYTATKVTGNSRRLYVTGTGPIGSSMGGPAPAMSGTVSEVAAEMADSCGVAVAIPEELSTYQITIPEGFKWREVLAYIAGLYFGFAY